MSKTSSIDPREALLQAWIDMSLLIRGNRLVTRFSFNEMVICRILYANQVVQGVPVTAAELCRRMQLLKSQINKILTSMEQSGYIERVRSQDDRRKMEIRLTPMAAEMYRAEHERILGIMSHVQNHLGEEQAQMLTTLLKQTVQAVEMLNNAESERKNP